MTKKYKTIPHFSIYKYIFPNGEIYVGQTIQYIKDRWDSGFGYTRGRIYEAIKYYKSLYGPHFIPEIEIIDYAFSEEEANFKEKAYILYYRDILGIDKVLNDESGGKSGYSLSEFAKQKMSESRIRLIHNNPEEYLTPVIQYAYDSITVIAKYNSIKEAADATGLHAQSICACIHNRQLSTGNYRWYKDDGKVCPIIQYPQDNRKAVYQIDKNTGAIVAMYDSMFEAANQTNTRYGDIKNTVRGRQKSANGYRWVLVSDYQTTE